MRTERRLNGIFPAPGTVLGPDWSGMFLTVVNIDDKGCLLRPTLRADFDAVPPEARSVTEHQMIARDMGALGSK